MQRNPKFTVNHYIIALIQLPDRPCTCSYRSRNREHQMLSSVISTAGHKFCNSACFLGSKKVNQLTGQAYRQELYQWIWGQSEGKGISKVKVFSIAFPYPSVFMLPVYTISHLATLIETRNICVMERAEWLQLLNRLHLCKGSAKWSRFGLVLQRTITNKRLGKTCDRKLWTWAKGGFILACFF